MNFLLALGEDGGVPEGFQPIFSPVGALYVNAAVKFRSFKTSDNFAGYIFGDMVRSADYVTLATLTDAMSECNHVICWGSDGILRLWGGMTGASAVFYTSTSRRKMVSDDPSLLAGLSGAKIDISELAIRLSDASLSYPFINGVLWEGVKMVSPGERLLVSEENFKTENWWKRPQKEIHLQEAARKIQKALKDVVFDCLSQSSDLVVDISGGLDSTTIAFAVAEQQSVFNATTIVDNDEGNSDVKWAKRAVSDLKCEHHLMGIDSTWMQTELNGHYWKYLPEGPTEADRYLPLIRTLQSTFSKETPVLHLNGQAGDELFGVVSALPWSLARTKNYRDLISIWRTAKANRQNKFQLLAFLLKNDDPKDDLEKIALGSLDGVGDEISMDTRWIPPVRLPFFATDISRDLLRSKCKFYSGLDGLKLDSDRTKHQIIENLLFHGSVMRRTNKMIDPNSNFSTRALFLDRRIIEPAVALLASDRIAKGINKPLLAASRPTNMAIDYFCRVDKGEYSNAVFAEFRARKKEILADFSEGMILGDLGLIDIDKLVKNLHDFSPYGVELDEILKVHRMEKWLRSYEASSIGEKVS